MESSTSGPRDTKSLMRSGTAARLAGVSTSTLRVWEHRYGVVSPPKSASGHRKYSMEDIQRLRLIKRLTLDVHAIGMVAKLDIDQLVQLSSGSQASSSKEAPRVLVIGHGAARKLEGRLRPKPVQTFEDLSHAEREIARCGPIDVLALHVHTLQSSVTERILELRAGLPASDLIVVYSFGAEALAETLRAAGATVRREPITGRELARLILASKSAPAPAAAATATAMSTNVPAASPRRYSDAELVSLAEMPSAVLCECPRHLAEIVAMLVSFERYSAECTSSSPADAVLHRHLNEVTAVARTLFEQALTRVVIDEGLAL